MVGYAGQYEVSDCGRVRSLDRMRPYGGSSRYVAGVLLTQKTHPSGHKMVGLSKHGSVFTAKVHRLVLEAFVGPCPVGMETCHWDDNPANNRLENLRWDTSKANKLDMVRNGGNHNANKTHCPKDHPLSGDNLVVSKLSKGIRECRTCSIAKARAQTVSRRRG